MVKHEWIFKLNWKSILNFNITQTTRFLKLKLRHMNQKFRVLSNVLYLKFLWVKSNFCCCQIDFLLFPDNLNLASVIIVYVVEINLITFFCQQPGMLLFGKHPCTFVVETCMERVNFQGKRCCLCV